MVSTIKNGVVYCCFNHINVSNNEWFEDLSLDVINHERNSTDVCLGLSTWSIHHLPATGSTDKIYKSWKEGKLINLLTPYILLEFNGRLTFPCRLMIAPKVWFISCFLIFLYKIPICLRNPQNQNYWIFLDIPGYSPKLDVVKPAWKSFNWITNRRFRIAIHAISDGWRVLMSLTYNQLQL